MQKPGSWTVPGTQEVRPINKDQIQIGFSEAHGREPGVVDR